MQIEIATTDSFKDIRDGAFVDALPDSDFTAKLLLKKLPAGQDIFYRIRFQDLASPTIVGKPMVGRFRTAPRDRRSISFCWSGDQAGQGWGIDESRGGRGRMGCQEIHQRHRRLLRPRRERPRCRTAEQGHELAPLHSITSSARARSVGGTSRPRVLAVWAR